MMSMDREGDRAATDKEEGWSWQQTHAEVKPTGDLEWAPRPFVYEAGESIRYVDYEGGDDGNDGTKDAPWQHHPWDPEAEGKAAACRGIHTYVFKRGVAYRGQLMARDSGAPGNPIRLTSDPDWGEGEARVYGSVAITGGWQRCDAASAPPGLPEPDKVWWTDIGTEFTPRCLWETRDGRITRIPIARTPNWQASDPDDIKSEWYEWKQVEVEREPVPEGRRRRWRGRVRAIIGMDPEHLTADEPDAYAGATLWTEYAGVMGSPYATPVEEYDPERHAIRFATAYGEGRVPSKLCRYFLENLPLFLNSPGEYYYAADGPHAGRLYVRLPDDRDPDESVLEAARHLTIIDIRNQSHIAITGLTFRFENVWNWFVRPAVHLEVQPACVRALGSCTDIRVSNCTFEHVAKAVRMYAEGDDDLIDQVEISDNDIANTEHSAIWIQDGRMWGQEPPYGSLYRVRVMRNRLRDIAMRPRRAPNEHALWIQAGQLIEVAGNVLDRTGGAGINVIGGKGGDRRDRPLIRVLVHHNKVTNPLLNSNDWGGIETWQGGPTYVYSNISGNPGGYWRFKHIKWGEDPAKRDHATARFGFAYYLDGAFKNYVFNNIAWGKSNDLASPLCNSAGIKETVGFMNALFNNTVYKFAVGSHRQATQGGRNYYLGNLYMDVSEYVFYHTRAKDAPRAPDAADIARGRGRWRDSQPYPYDTLAYANNIFNGSPRRFGSFEHTGDAYETLEGYREALTVHKPLAGQVGWLTDKQLVRDAEAHDFRPTAESPALGRGIRFFVPWGLYAVAGEWHFYLHPQDPTRILGENFYMTDEYAERSMYRQIPRNDLTARNVGADDFVAGALEDWTHGALALNGRDQYCVLTDTDLRSDYEYGRRRWRRTQPGAERSRPTYPGAKRRTVDMDTNNFLIEVHMKTAPGHTGGVIVAKAAEAGYVLSVDEEGRARLALRADGQTVCSRSSSVPVNDGEWHHVIAEVDRGEPEGVTLYVDGVRADGPLSGAMPSTDASLANTADFLVGKGPKGNHFAGALDFLRVSRGTLADAETTIEEIYEWQFNGPFTKDFFGNEPDGKRDAGAIQHVD